MFKPTIKKGFKIFYYKHLETLCITCREEGIRTLETRERLHTFQACSFNHSDTSLFKMDCEYTK